MRAKDGTWRWVRSRGRVTERDAEGRALRLVGTVTDVDAQHHEQERRLNDARLRGLENRINEIELVMRVDGRILEANDKALAAYGYSREEMRGLGVHDLRSPETRAGAGDQLAQLLTAEGMHFETAHCRRDGSVFPVNVSSRAFSVGEERYIHSLVRDLTEERRDQAERAFYAGLTRRMRDAVIVTDAEARVVAYTGAAQAIYGLTEAEALGRDIRDVVTHDSPSEELARHRAELAAGEPSRLQTRALRKDGTWIELDVMVDVLHDEAGHITGHFSVSRDITTLKAVEATLHAALGERETLLKEVHHRVKNNLQMMVSLFALEAGAVKDPEAVAALLDSQERLRSMALIHEQLYQAPDLARIDFGAFVQLVVGGLGTVFGARPGVVFDVKVGDAWLGVDTAIPCALIVNELVSNALKYAFPGGRGGRIEVALRALPTLGSFALSVADDGVGLPEGFDPAKSATLGMQLVAILARQLHGHLTIDRSRGSRFEIAWSAREKGAS
jgi:PAS domain S-box-containing protein